MNILKKIKVSCQLYSLPSITKWINSIIWSFGLLWLAIKIINYFFTEWATKNIQPYWWFFLAAGIIIAFIRNFPKTSFVCEINETDTSVEIRIGSVFDSHETIVVGANTTFDTAMEDGTISPKSVQGKFTSQYCTSVIELDQKLTNCLRGITPKVLTNIEKPYGKTKQYPIGTVAKINCQSRTAYFTAIAHMNEDRNAYSSEQNILDALPILWEFIRSRGELGNICIPIIGSGFSRVNAKKETLVKEILRSFVIACSEGRFCEKITLFIHPDDIKNKKINFDIISDFVKYICTYENRKISDQNAETDKSEVIDNHQHNKYIKATCFLLEDDGDSLSPRKGFRTIIENVAGTIQKAVPALLEAKNFKEFIEKCNKTVTIQEELGSESHDRPGRPKYKSFSVGVVPPNYRKKKMWALDFDNNVYLNEYAKNLFNEEFMKLKVSIEQP